MQSFTRWLGAMREQNEKQIRRLLADETATQFLLAWALFESKCFDGYLKARNLKPFVEKLYKQSGHFDRAILDASRHFHERYQDRRRLRNLAPKARTSDWMIEELGEMLSVTFDELEQRQQGVLTAYVVYRFRNNMFHGAKGIGSWLRYKEQIRFCIAAMQGFISCAEKQTSTMGAEVA